MEKYISYFEEAQTFGIDTLEEPFQSYVLVYTAQGIIDNGGVRYLFENKFKAQYAYTDTYEMIINAYSAYGFVKLSLMLKKVYVAHKSKEKNRSLDLSDAHTEETDELFFAYSDTVYKKLEKVEYYLEQHELTKKHILSVWGSEHMNGFKKIYNSTMIILYPFIKIVDKKLWNTFY